MTVPCRPPPRKPLHLGPSIPFVAFFFSPEISPEICLSHSTIEDYDASYALLTTTTTTATTRDDA